MELRLNQCQNIPGNFITKGTERLQLKAKESFFSTSYLFRWSKNYPLSSIPVSKTARHGSYPEPRIQSTFSFTLPHKPFQHDIYNYALPSAFRTTFCIHGIISPMSATFLSTSSFFAWLSNKTLRAPDPTIHGLLHYCFLHDSVRLSPDCPQTSWTQFLSTRSQTLVWEAETWTTGIQRVLLTSFHGESKTSSAIHWWRI